MTDTTFKSFAYRLFHAIRGNKKALLAELPPATFSHSEGYEQREAKRRLINAMFQFERYARGSQKALAGDREQKYFTLKARRDVNPAVCFVEFTEQASQYAHRVVRLILDCQGLLTGPTWQAILAIEGTNNAGFRDVVRPHIINDRLPGVVKTFSDITVVFPQTNILRMTFKTGAAVKDLSEHFPLPNVEGKTLEEQIVRMNQYWAHMKHFVREAAKDPQNWPSLVDSRNVEVQNVNNLLTQFYRGLKPEQKALLQKYPEEVNKFFSNTM